MPRRILLCRVLPAFAVAGLLTAAAAAQSQDSQSITEAARRAREQKKAAAKPAKVFTDDEVKPAEPSGSAATPAPAPGAAPAPSDAASASGAQAATGPKDEKSLKEIEAVKELLKQMQSDLDLLKREQALQQDTYFSNPDYVHNTAGKAKLDAMKQQITDKQQALDQLKAKLAELGGTLDKPEAAPPKP